MSKPAPGPSWSLSPAEWKSRVPYDSWTDRFTPDEGVALHNGGNGNYPAGQPPYSVEKEIAQLRAWEDYHIDGRGWRGLAYGWAIGQTGVCYRIRGWNTYGAHQGDIDGDGISNNQEWIPVLWIASGLHHVPSPAFHATFIRLRVYLEDVSARRLYLRGHKEIQPKPTSCPGPNGMEYVMANRWLTPPIPEPEPDPDPDPEPPSEEDDMKPRVLALKAMVEFAHTHTKPCPIDELVASKIIGPPGTWWHTLLDDPDHPDWWTFFTAIDINTALAAART